MNNCYHICLLVLAIVFSIISFTSCSAQSHSKKSSISTVNENEELKPSNVISPKIPENIVFSGDTVFFKRYDLRERIDRELISFSYMHTSTLLFLKNANRYFSQVEPILKANGIPDDFKYLMVAESSLRPGIVSPAGAAGLWQLMPETAKEYGLEVNKNVDERFNLEKSTVAACDYLKKSYAMFGDWLTVAASYNVGHGRVLTELKKQNVTKAADMWLPEETSRYMFRILAVKQIMNHPKEYGFFLKSNQLYKSIDYRNDTVMTSIDSLAVYAREKGISYYQLKDANRWLRDDHLDDKSGKMYIIKIPKKESLYY